MVYPGDLIVGDSDGVVSVPFYDLPRVLALSQAKLFKEAAGVDELILTKLDGTAKGGVAIAVAMQEKLPITYVGLGEKLEDLRPFNGADYARALLGDLDQGKWR